MKRSSKMNGQQGLYRSEYEHDACGVGLVADLNGTPSHAIVAAGLTVLKRLMHRGATGNDPETGDGAGLLLQLPKAFFRKVLSRAETPRRREDEVFAVGMIFGGEGEEEKIETIVKENGCGVLAWREVPTNPDAIGHDARAVMPRIRQIFMAADKDDSDDRREMRDERRDDKTSDLETSEPCASHVSRLTSNPFENRL
ncbi:MAG: hypothetical protein II924_01385, partial [Kiritimatiellae bacterium]|nr:hypothetical protein [Kiritimatiellia bacterium]